MDYKAIFLDIDDTLIGKSKHISEGNRLAVRAAQDQGVYVAIATGRGYKGCTSIWRELQVQGPIITYGGACIVDTRTDKLLFMADIEPSLITEALEFARECGLIAQVYQGDTVISETENEISKHYTSILNLEWMVDKDMRAKKWENMPKVLVFSPVEQEAEMVARFEERFGGRLEVASSKPGFIELNRCGNNKGTAMLRLAKDMGFEREELIAVGDNTLDIQMIECAGLGVCVGDGQEKVKTIADVIAPACDEDAVKWVIDTYILKR